MLQAQNVQFQAYDLPVEKLSAVETAQFLEVSPNIVYKTIVVKREGTKKHLLILVPGTAEVDLKQVAQAFDDRKVHLATAREAESITGLQVGGISPLALINRGFQLLVDSSAQQLDEIHISGGQRGLNIRIAVADLMRLTGGRFADVGRRDIDQ